MSTAAQPITGIPAFGTLIQVLSSAPGATPEEFTTIEGVGDITGPANSMAEIETTSHSTGVPIKTVIPGLIDLGDLTFPCYWNPEEPTQNVNSPFGLEYLFWNRKITKFQLVMPNETHRTRQFLGFVKTIGETYPVQGVCTRNTAIRITSPLTDVASPISLSPATGTATAAGLATPATFDVKAGGNNAPWTAVPTVPWLHITAPTGPTVGDGVVTFTVDPNTTAPVAPRTGTIEIGALSLVFTVTQSDT